MSPAWWDRIDLGVVLLDAQGHTLLANGWLRQHARLPHPHQGLTLAELFGPALSPRVSAAVDQALQRGHSTRLSWALHPSPLPLWPPGADTQRLRHAVDVVALTDAQGQRQCLLQVRDMTESTRREDLLRRQARQLQASEERLAAILDHAPIGMALGTLDGQWTYVNRALCQILSESADHLIGQPARSHVHPDDWAGHERFEREVVQGGRSDAQIEERWVNRSGQAVWVRLTATRLVDVGLATPSVILQIEPIGERKRKDAEIAAALNEKETLLREVYHRVKNNLQVIQSLLNLKRRSLDDAQAGLALSETAERVRAMALVHEKLYQSQKLSAIDLADYLNDLVQPLQEVLGARHRGVTVTVSAEPVEADLNAAIPFGLIVTELLTNSLKHAFPEPRGGAVRVALQAHGAGARLRVADDGVGMATVAGQPPRRSLGLNLVDSLARQIDATVQVDPHHHPGVCVDVLLPPLVSRRPASPTDPSTPSPASAPTAPRGT